MNRTIKQGEALLVNDTIDESAMKDHFMNVPHSVRASFTDCCEPEFIYTPVFGEEALMQVSL